MNRQSEFPIDPRSEENLRKKIAGLAAAYTPEWTFDEKNPDAGSVIGLIFAGQMAENIRRMNRVMEKYHTEFVNMLRLSLLPAAPAEGVAVLELMEGAASGVDVPKGTRLVGARDSADSQSISFETVSDIHLTNARLCDILMISGRLGKILPLLGEACRPEFVPAVGPADEQRENPVETLRPFSLFDFRESGIERNALLMYHRNLFDTAPGVSLSVRLTGSAGGEDRSGFFAEPERFRWSYYGDGKMKPFERVEARGGAVVLSKSGTAGKLPLGGEEYSMICAEALGPIREAVDLGQLEISSSCAETDPEFVLGGAEELDAAEFLPFGETVSVFDECYIGHDRIFSQRGAEVTLRFSLSSREKLATFVREPEKEDLRVIKRKPKTIPFETVRTSPQRVTLEYFNGTGWRRLICRRDWSTLFDGTNGGETAISFVCPEDWLPAVAGGYNRRCLRLRVAQADNCYLQPCIHKMPVIRGLKLSYTYEENWETPQRLVRVCGTEFTDLTVPLISHRTVTAFSPLACAGNALLLGFDRKIEGAPVSILFHIGQSVSADGPALTFEYSAPSGFEPLKVIDRTHHLTGPGTVLFMPPSDFSQRKVEGISRYWIRVSDSGGAYDRADRARAVIREILPNAVEIRNVQTGTVEPFYLNVSSPNMSFPLSAGNILSAEVFVNEAGVLPRTEMRRMLEEQPENVRAEYDGRGELRNFFVRWTEVENFDRSIPSDRHYVIDRTVPAIRFGDGMNVRIPQARQGVAFTVRPVSCDGAAGNLPAGGVNASSSVLLSVDRIYNPIATCGGSNLESVENARLRGAGRINSKDRLVSELDFVREVRSFSGGIDKVKCVVGAGPDGLRGNFVTVAVMMRDYAEGAYSFNGIRERLRRHLLQKCEATVPENALIVIEPSYVEISVDVWVCAPDADRTFEIQNRIRNGLREFLEPLSDGKRAGWKIGELPSEFQVRQMLRNIPCGAEVRRSVIAVRYTDRSGTHERGLDELTPTPFMIGVSGAHSVHVTPALRTREG